MPPLEYINEEGYRLDGRKPNECRLIKISIGNENIFTDADGFSFYEVGNTKILSYIQGPTELKKSEEKCSIKCEVFLSPFNVYEKRKKKTKDSITNEISAYIRNICENIILLDLYRNSEINVFLYIIERDGGVKHAAINTCILALIDAGIAIKYFISACSVLYLQNHVVVDANQLEINSGAPELTMVIELNTHKIILLEFDAEVPIDIFEDMIRMCIECCVNIGNSMKLTVKENAIKLLSLNNMLSA
ncbi:exosome complex exonuclease RRP41, putative (RRP41) [Plasmodium ovale wallikeri]|uniref:Exosome complex exonuclease RRP41, putative n=3 Tax=Plasmodium ovale TaxID=36330 RepID=A0A1C3KX64_PLAOA|nr:exosome complex exonuclease RRP41, putative (RRP41) [Plasmodium ovale curtisi]SBT45235.1 exosome complex exonuclease RRP41, putative (RRP41) [Plasmodium ovale wallikeri]SBT78806.1 exosome complex exonuclease RRP41, putative [Plasmodium ovale]SBS97542.1 exosome complex exonuclease RRP41, putative (RRP41) [Plasmodium ovale curtisi]SBT45838.1 exosome complex exonuclease RRP41, putative (RRP41) [Plasmodium ovale wallikeri]